MSAAKKKAKYAIRVIAESGQVVQTSPRFDSKKEAQAATKRMPAEVAAGKASSK